MAILTSEVKSYFEGIQTGNNGLISSRKLQGKMRENEKMFILDMRKREDFDAGHIEGSFHCEWHEIGSFIEDDIFSKDEPIVVICYSGQTSGQVVGVLRSLGYNASSLFNGINASDVVLEASCST